MNNTVTKHMAAIVDLAKVALGLLTSLSTYDSVFVSHLDRKLLTASRNTTYVKGLLISTICIEYKEQGVGVACDIMACMTE